MLSTPEFRTTLLARGAEPTPMTPVQFAAFLRDETARYKKVIELAGQRAE